MLSNCSFHKDQAKSLLINQFRESEHFNRLIEQQADSFDKVECILNYLDAQLDIDTATGFWLDIIGTIVGQPRQISGAIAIAFFGFVEYPPAGRFGEERFWDGSEPLTASSLLEDPEYRWAIRARISSNYADVSLIGVSNSMSVLANTSDILVGSSGTAEINLYWGIHMPYSLQLLLKAIDLLPIAAGIGVGRQMFGVPALTFGFLETPLDFVGFDAGNFAGEFYF